MLVARCPRRGARRGRWRRRLPPRRPQRAAPRARSPRACAWPCRARCPPLDRLRVTTTQVAGGLRQPVLVRSAADGSRGCTSSSRPGGCGSTGRRQDPGTYLDIRGRGRELRRAGACSGSRSRPTSARSRLLFVTYTRRRRRARAGALPRGLAPRRARVSTATRRTILVVPHPGAPTTTAATSRSVPTAKLYLGTGDGGSGGDPPNNAQNLRSLLGQDAAHRRALLGAHALLHPARRTPTRRRRR